MGIPISLNSLTGNEGWILAEPIRNNYGQVLCPENKTLDYLTIEQLKKYFSKSSNTEISKVRINVKLDLNQSSDKQKILMDNIKKQNCDIDGSIPLQLKNETIDALSKIYNPTENNIENILNIIYSCVEDISLKIQDSPNLSYSLGQYKETNTNISGVINHSFRVAQFAVTLANIYNEQIIDSNEHISLKDIGTAALLHDYGVNFRDSIEMDRLKNVEISDIFFKIYPMIPSDILKQPYNEKYKNVYAYAALKDLLNSHTLTAILLSNEDEKGTASLNIVNNKTNSSSIAAKIIFLCNLYDTLLFNAISSNESLENVSTLLETLIANGIINETIGNLFLNNIPLYSIGVRVELSNGKYATVVERFNGSNSSRPIVQTLINPPFNSETIDLRTTTNITIKRVVASNELLDEKIKEITHNQLQTLGITTIDEFQNNQNENKRPLK